MQTKNYYCFLKKIYLGGLVNTMSIIYLIRPKCYEQIKLSLNEMIEVWIYFDFTKCFSKTQKYVDTAIEDSNLEPKLVIFIKLNVPSFKTQTQFYQAEKLQTRD